LITIHNSYALITTVNKNGFLRSSSQLGTANVTDKLLLCVIDATRYSFVN